MIRFKTESGSLYEVDHTEGTIKVTPADFEAPVNSFDLVYCPSPIVGKGVNMTYLVDGYVHCISTSRVTEVLEDDLSGVTFGEFPVKVTYSSEVAVDIAFDKEFAK